MDHVFLFLTVVCLVAVHQKSQAASVVEVSPEIGSSLEKFLKSRSNVQMDTAKPLKMNPNVMPPKERKKHSKPEMLEDALRKKYHELFEAYNASSNATNVTNKYHAVKNARRNFIKKELNKISVYVVSLLENSLKKWPGLPFLDAQECLKMSICDAHNQPKKYGLIGLILQFLFPPYSKTEDPTNVASKYQLAAWYGRQSNADCAVQYDDCLLNILDIIQFYVNLFKP